MVPRRGGRDRIKVDGEVVMDREILVRLAIGNWTLLDRAVFTEEFLYDAALTRDIIDWVNRTALEYCEHERVGPFKPSHSP